MRPTSSRRKHRALETRGVFPIATEEKATKAAASGNLAQARPKRHHAVFDACRVARANAAARQARRVAAIRAVADDYGFKFKKGVRDRPDHFWLRCPGCGRSMSFNVHNGQGFYGGDCLAAEEIHEAVIAAREVL
jgi:hypothetical protein